MKQTYSNFKSQRSSFLTLPPAGAYVARIENVKVIDPTDKNPHTVIELILDIKEGEYTHRFMDVFDEQKNRFGDANYRGSFRITVPTDEDADEDNWVKRKFESSMWCIEQSNTDKDGKLTFEWDWDEKKLKKLTVGISIRNRIYDYNGSTRKTIEIGRLEVAQDVRDGKVKPMPDRDQRNKDNGSAAEVGGYTAVDTEVPWG